MYQSWHAVALVAACVFINTFAIALGGQKFTDTPDKRQVQDLVRLRL
jgi:hypothetical protein